MVLRTYASLDDVEGRWWDEITTALPLRKKRLQSVFMGRDPRFFLAQSGDAALVACVQALDGESFPFLDPPALAAGGSALASLADPSRYEECSRRVSVAPELPKQYPSLVCSAPWALHSGMAGHLEWHEGVTRVIEAVDGYAQAMDAASTAFLYLPASAAVAQQRLRDTGYRIVSLGGDCYLDTTASSFSVFLASLSSKKRYRVQHEMAAFHESGLKVASGSVSLLQEHLDAFAELSARLQERYGHEYDPSGERAGLEALMRAYDAPSIKVYEAVDATGEVIAFHVLVEHRGVLHSNTVGQNYAVGPTSRAHFMVMYYAPLADALESHISRINYGVGSYEAKVGRGCRIEPLVGAFKLRDPSIDLLACLQHESSERSAALQRFS